jgi:membrane protease YdiL (CAAX protease family)
VIFVLAVVATAMVPVNWRWPFPWLVPLMAYGLVVVSATPLRRSFRPWPLGELSRSAALATLIIAAGSCTVLVMFHRTAHPDVSAYRDILPVSKMGGLLVAGVMFSIFNAILEEIIFRGILFDAAESQWGQRAAVGVTAFLFGYAHMHGYPPGPLGAVLAGIYGLCLGWLRIFTRGLGWPVLAHVTADATIFTLLAQSGILG